MIKLKSVSMKNFQSIGNVTQTVRLDSDSLILVLGANLDQGHQDYRNGTGKTTITQAISFAIFGNAMTNIRKDNLVNKINNKDMMVSIEFEVNQIQYRIERGRKPAVLRFYINDSLLVDPENEANGESKFTQENIDTIIGMSHRLYKQIISLSSRTTPFLSLRDAEQREIIEELLGITSLSKKADKLNLQLKDTKDKIKEEEIRLKTIGESNDKINSHIKDLTFKSSLWEKTNQKNIAKQEADIENLKNIDIEAEINNHKIARDISVLDMSVQSLTREITSLDRELKTMELKHRELNHRLTHIKDKTCPECNQSITNDASSNMENDIEKSILDSSEKIKILNSEIANKAKELNSILDAKDTLGQKPILIYKNIDDAYNHQRLLDSISSDLKTLMQNTNPYDDQIANLSDSAIQEICYDYLNQMISLKDHQEFLLKLLTKKDSFIRKKIIDQNLSFLNTRLNHYLDIMNLPHEVIFNSDLTVNIIKHGKDYDFDQLSTGEQNRLILSLSWSFRDIWETFNQSVNIYIIDELVDSGMDAQGVARGLDILSSFVLERNKNILLISHKGEIENRVDKILYAEKENDFTTYRFKDE